jgi:hypothetical protein
VNEKETMIQRTTAFISRSLASNGMPWPEHLQFIVTEPETVAQAQAVTDTDTDCPCDVLVPFSTLKEAAGALRCLYGGIVAGKEVAIDIVAIDEADLTASTTAGDGSPVSTGVVKIAVKPVRCHSLQALQSPSTSTSDHSQGSGGGAGSAVVVVRGYLSQEDLEDMSGSTEELSHAKRDLLRLADQEQQQELGPSATASASTLVYRRVAVWKHSGDFSSFINASDGESGDGELVPATAFVDDINASPRGDGSSPALPSSSSLAAAAVVACVGFTSVADATAAMLSLDGSNFGGQSVRATVCPPIRRSKTNTPSSTSTSTASSAVAAAVVVAPSSPRASSEPQPPQDCSASACTCHLETGAPLRVISGMTAMAAIATGNKEASEIVTSQGPISDGDGGAYVSAVTADDKAPLMKQSEPVLQQQQSRIIARRVFSSASAPATTSAERRRSSTTSNTSSVTTSGTSSGTTLYLDDSAYLQSQLEGRGGGGGGANTSSDAGQGGAGTDGQVLDRGRPKSKYVDALISPKLAKHEAPIRPLPVCQPRYILATIDVQLT